MTHPVALGVGSSTSPFSSAPQQHEVEEEVVPPVQVVFQTHGMILEAPLYGDVLVTAFLARGFLTARAGRVVVHLLTCGPLLFFLFFDFLLGCRGRQGATLTLPSGALWLRSIVDLAQPRLGVVKPVSQRGELRVNLPVQRERGLDLSGGLVDELLGEVPEARNGGTCASTPPRA